MISPTVAAGNSTSAIGSPEARLFFDPQNSGMIPSPRSSWASRPTKVVKTSTTANSAVVITPTSTSCHGLTLVQMRSTTPIEKAVYTTRRIGPRSTALFSTVWRATVLASQGRSS